MKQSLKIKRRNKKMRFRDDVKQFSVNPYIPIPVNKLRLESIKSYLKSKKMQDEVDVLTKEKEKLTTAIVDVKDCKEDLTAFLLAEIQFAERGVIEEVKNWMSHYGGKEGVVLDKIIRLNCLRNININEDISEKGLPSGITKAKRDKQLKEKIEKIESLKNNQKELIPEGTVGQPWVDEKFWIANWEKLSPLFWDAISVDGRFLDVTNEVDRGIEELYFQLGYDKIPKVPFYKIIKLGDTEYKIPPSHGHPDWNLKKEIY